MTSQMLSLDYVFSQPESHGITLRHYGGQRYSLVGLHYKMLTMLFGTFCKNSEIPTTQLKRGKLRGMLCNNMLRRDV